MYWYKVKLVLQKKTINLYYGYTKKKKLPQSKSVAEENDLDAHIVRRWVREFHKYEKNSFQGNGNPVQTDEEARIVQLEKELNRVKME